MSHEIQVVGDKVEISPGCFLPRNRVNFTDEDCRKWYSILTLSNANLFVMEGDKEEIKKAKKQAFRMYFSTLTPLGIIAMIVVGLPILFIVLCIVLFVLTFVVALILTPFGIWQESPNNNNSGYSARERPSKVTRLFMGREKLKSILKDPSSLEIISESEDFGHYKARYRAKNSFGGYVVNNFECDVD